MKRKNGDHFTTFLTLLGSKNTEITPEKEVPEVTIMSFFFYFSFPVLPGDGDPPLGLWI